MKKNTIFMVLLVLALIFAFTAPALATEAYADGEAAVISKNPGGETVKEGGSTLFTAAANNYAGVSWKIVSFDGETVLSAEQAPGTFSGLSVKMYKQTSWPYNEAIKLENIPASMNGWKVVADFLGNDGNVVSTTGATVAIEGLALPTPTPAPTPEPTPVPEPSEMPIATEEPDFATVTVIDTEPETDTGKAVSSSKKGGYSLLTLIIVALLAAAVSALITSFVLNGKKSGTGKKKVSKTSKSKKQTSFKRGSHDKKDAGYEYDEDDSDNYDPEELYDNAYEEDLPEEDTDDYDEFTGFDDLTATPDDPAEPEAEDIVPEVSAEDLDSLYDQDIFDDRFNRYDR